MNREQSRELVRQTFTHAFDKSRFGNLVINLLNHFDEGKSSAMTVPDAFTPHIRSCWRLGTYKSPEGQLADVLIVNTTEAYKLERTRTAFRDFVAHKLKRQDSYKEAGLVAFVSPDSRAWRFSYIRMEYQSKRDAKTGKIAVEERLTPARRFSYIVGEGESCHTAQTRFVGLLQDKETGPNLADIEEAFSVEPVTKEFDKEYRKLFEKINDALKKVTAEDRTIREEFQSKGVNTVDFAKKLMGQIVFLYFLQKKGWLGVAKGNDWGSGPRDFLRRLTNREYGKYDNFFNDVLEPLFYDTLATDRGHEAWCDAFKCRIPFLNGGLFEPLCGYDWKKTDIILPNKLFTNTDFVEEGVSGTGVLDVFERYNFTVNEAEPLEKEVAIDPEMLGKVFENLIEENRRKGLGAYYTPREIVHYMCQETLINYLDTALNTRPRSLVPAEPKQGKLLGEPEPEQTTLQAAVYEQVVPRADIETFVHLGEQYSFYEAAKQSGTIGREYPKPPKSIENYARQIDDKMADIAVCDPAVGSGAFPVGMMTEIVRARCALTPYFNDFHERTPYYFKRHAIQSCLYGVDIDTSAVEIAKLRLWLSLVVDEEDVKQIKPLPNLDFKIMAGNSLLGFLFQSLGLTEIEKLKIEYFDEPDHIRKAKLKERIDQRIQIHLGMSEESHGYHVDFDYRLFFSEVFRAHGGFDVVIGNPPYGIVFDPEYKSRLTKLFSSFKQNSDIYSAFFERSIRLLHPGGQFAFITPNTYLNGDYFTALRSFLSFDTILKGITDYKQVPVFDDPTVFVAVLLCSYLKPVLPYTVRLRVAQTSTTNLAVSSFKIMCSNDGPFKPSDPVLERLQSNPLFALIDELFFVKDVGFNYWTTGRGKKRGENSIGDRVFYSGEQRDKRDIPFLKGRDILRWKTVEPSNFLRHDYAKKLDPAIDTFRFSGEFLSVRPKVIYRQTSSTIIAAIDTSGQYLDKTVHLIVPRGEWRDGQSDKLLVGLLNSSLFNYLYRHISQETQGRAFAQVKTTYIKKLPVPRQRSTDSDRVVEIVNRILVAQSNGQDIGALESELDRHVYALYGLSKEEMVIVEGSESK